MDLGKDKPRYKTKSGRKRKKKKRKRKPKLPELPKIVLLNAIESLRRKLKRRNQLRKRLDEQTTVYEKLYRKEYKEKQECAEALQNVIKEAETAIEILHLDFEAWLDSRSRVVQRRDRELTECQEKCQADITAQKSDIRAKKAELKNLRKFVEEKEVIEQKLEATRDAMIRQQLELDRKLEDYDKLYRGALLTSESVLKNSLLDAAEDVDAKVRESVPWLHPLVEETRRIKHYLKELRDIAMYSHESGNEASEVEQFQSVLENVRRGEIDLKNLVTDARKGREVIAELKRKMRASKSVRESSRALERKQRNADDDCRRTEDELKHAKNGLERKIEELRAVEKRREDLSKSDVHDVHAALVERYESARQLLAGRRLRDGKRSGSAMRLFDLLGLEVRDDEISVLRMDDVMAIPRRCRRTLYFFELGSMGLIPARSCMPTQKVSKRT